MKYFTIDELCRSDFARLNGIANIPDEEAKRNLEKLADTVLDPLREAWGRPIRVTSGYRCRAVNEGVGGAARSYHLQGRAADITGQDTGDFAKLYQLVCTLRLPHKELILEPSWVHVAV